MADEKLFGVMEKGLKKVLDAKYNNKILSPFFTSISTKNKRELLFKIKNGGVINEEFSEDDPIQGRIEVRIGDYKKGGGFGTEEIILPTNINETGSMRELIRGFNKAYWDASEDYNIRKQKNIEYKGLRDVFLYFSEEEPIKYIARDKKNLDVTGIYQDLEERLSEVSAKLLKKEVLNTNISCRVTQIKRYLINSEGTKVFTPFLNYAINLTIEMLNKENLVIPLSRLLSGRDYTKLPNNETLIELGEKLIEDLNEIKDAPVEVHGVYPLLSEGHFGGFVAHEGAGHILEGVIMQQDIRERFQERKVNIFENKIGKKVAPDFISLYDDPLIPNSYTYHFIDEEGVKAEKVELIKNGILKNYLTSRQSAGYLGIKSNGHGLAQDTLSPVSRMSNLILESEKVYSFDKLKEKMIKICINKKIPYGLIMRRASHGCIDYENSLLTVYPAYTFRIYPGRKKLERVRDAYMIGTVYTLLNKIVATTDQYVFDDGTCGSLSGEIPSTTCAPGILFESAEIGSLQRDILDRPGRPIVRIPRKYFRNKK